MEEASGPEPGPERSPSESYLRVTARGPTGPLPAAVTSGVFAIYFLVEAFEPFSTFRLVLGMATAMLTVRLALRATLVAGRGGIKWRSVMRTWSWPYSAVDHFELAVRTRASGPALRVMRIHLVDGHAQWLAALEEVPAHGSSPGPSDRDFPGLSGIAGIPGLVGLGLLRRGRAPVSLEESVAQLNRMLTATGRRSDA